MCPKEFLSTLQSADVPMYGSFSNIDAPLLQGEEQMLGELPQRAAHLRRVHTASWARRCGPPPRSRVRFGGGGPNGRRLTPVPRLVVHHRPMMHMVGSLVHYHMAVGPASVPVPRIVVVPAAGGERQHDHQHGGRFLDVFHIHGLIQASCLHSPKRTAPPFLFCFLIILHFNQKKEKKGRGIQAACAVEAGRNVQGQFRARARGLAIFFDFGRVIC